MRKILLTLSGMAMIFVCSCNRAEKEEPAWIVDRFDDIKVIRYEVPAFEELSLNEKILVYYLSEAAKCGRDIIFDQNFKYNLSIRRALETIYEKYDGDRAGKNFLAMEKYLKKVWFANGIHHHYSNDKFKPEFDQYWFEKQLAKHVTDLPIEQSLLVSVMFDSSLYASRLNQTDGVDVVKESAGNFYEEGITQKEVEKFYNDLTDVNDPRPISYGLNSKLVRGANGRLEERVWKVGGMYSEALEQIVAWLEKAEQVAEEPLKQIISDLVKYYRSGNLRDFDTYSIHWAQDVNSKIDFVNGFIEDYGDPLGRKATWESVVNFRDEKACERTRIISENAQWFEDNAPINPAYRKKVVKGVSAKVITAAMLGGECYPATPIGINLPNADWIRKDYGSKSVTIDNITYAYDKAAQGNGFSEEFVLDEADRKLADKYGKLSDDLHTDLHECLGHGSGQMAPGVKGGELGTYTSTLEETRADLFGLYYIGDEKLVELGLIPSLDVAKTQYLHYILNGLLTQQARIELGKNVEESHMRNRMMIAKWCLEKGQKDKVIELVEKNSKHYVVINDYKKLRQLFGEMLYEVQRIKSEGDYEAGRQLVENYGVKLDLDLHKEIRTRYASLNIEPYGGFINPEYTLVEKNGKIVDVKVTYPTSYVEQMIGYSKNYSFLPSLN
ncbi:MAG: dihydrofolate reductase [Alistipes sp.]|nr:dihydrofolate reductase [Candidatus Alistipes equi]